MKTLTFKPWTETENESLAMFTVVYRAFLGMADNPNRAQGIQETRNAIKILDQFAAIADVVNAGTENEGLRLKKDGGTITLDDAQFTLLKRGVETWAGQVPFGLAKMAVEAVDFVDSATSQ